MTRRQITIWFVVGIVLALISVLLLDRPIAAFVQSVDGCHCAVLKEGTRWLEVASGFPINRYFVTFVLGGIALLLFLWKSTRATAWVILFIASAHIVTRLVAGILKNVFHRLRPFEVIEAGNWDWKFFGDHGSSFPSGHSAHFWGLFFPLAFLFPRYRIPLLVLPVFICVARVGVNDHWTSDVIASFAIAAAITLLFIWLYRMKGPAVKPGADAPAR
ncbi:MAG TPA: phosphatase PAP2 family protein [Chthoniobacterales bacterium]|nr:phosphatase PAP2 family protein [Chthoniobacterales bacterium]